MQRRQFLLSALATTMGTAIQAAPAPTLTFGFSLYGMRSLSLSEAIRACSKNGYEAIELAAMPDWPGDPAKLNAAQRRELRTLLTDTNLQLPAIMENWPLDGDDKKHQLYLERIKRVAQLAHDLGDNQPPVIETILGGKPEQWPTVRDAFTERLRAYAKVAEQAKVTIAMKAHRFGAMNRPEHVRWLLEQAGSKALAAVYDWSHFEQRDMTLKDTIKALAPVTRFVHIKDTMVDKGQARFVLPGEGKTDYGALLTELLAHQFNGCVCVEVSGMVSNQKGYDPVTAAEACMRKLQPIFAKIRGQKKPTP